MDNFKFDFGKSIAIPFISGVLGASLIIGGNYALSRINNNKDNNNENSISNSLNSSNSSSFNTSLISLEEFSQTGTSVAKKVLPSVVGIKVEFTVNSIFNRSTSTVIAEGSGVIITEDGYILTNNHVINSSSESLFYELSKANKVTVYLYNDETEYEATIVGMDEQTDLAVIKIDKTGLVTAELGDSDTVQVGEFAMAIGNPLGLQNSVSSGIISATNRKITSDGKTFTVIQTDAAINSGNSGGALVNSKGQIIGINTLKSAGNGVEGLGFSIPINSTKDIYKQLIEYNKVKRPHIGISGRDLSDSLAKANNLPVGIYITNIEDFSSAEKSGLKISDIIIKINGKDIKTMDELNEIKNTFNIGDEIKLTISRNGEEKEITLTLGEQP